MDGAFGTRRHRRKPFINITSLVDVMFILLLFLMVSTTFRRHQGLDISVPQAATATPQNKDTPSISVNRHGDYYFGGVQVDENGLRAAIADTLKKDPGSVMMLEADEGAEFGKVVRAMDIVREMGGEKMVIPTRMPEPSPVAP
ncbi:MAG: biopolymer transporter ExbD [FCB group bacterium]|jgi:biopolymer transport protein ExbD|nr:biopolymer transporter ExbD [FCB group bacterium]